MQTQDAHPCSMHAKAPAISVRQEVCHGRPRRAPRQQCAPGSYRGDLTCKPGMQNPVFHAGAPGIPV